MATIFDYAQQLHNLCVADRYSDALKLYETKIVKQFRQREIDRSFLVINCVTNAYCKTNQWNKGISYGLSKLDCLARMRTDVDYALKTIGWQLLKALIPNPPMVKPETLDFEKVEQLLKMLKERAACSDIALKLYLVWIRMLPGLQVDYLTGQRFYNLFQPEELINWPAEVPEKQLFKPIEVWYLNHSKYLYQHQRYQECCNLCDIGLNQANALSKDCQAWLTRRYALALKQMGDMNRAITLMEVLARKKLDWFIYHELGELYFQSNDAQNGEKCLVLAYRFGGHNPSKVNLYERLGDHCMNIRMPNIATEFYQLALKVRTEEGWKIPDSLMQKLPTKTTHTESAQLFRSLLRVFQKTIEVNDMLFGAGEITRILHEGPNGDGFITDTEGNTVYFRFSQANFDSDEVENGYPVKFKARRVLHRGEKRWQATKVYRD